MPPLPDPADLSPADRTRELAGLFATALARLLWAAPRPEKTSPENPPNELAVPPEPSVTVHAG